MRAASAIFLTSRIRNAATPLAIAVATDPVNATVSHETPPA
jgi:hypothetical protein